MALLKKLFGKKDPAANLREAFQRHEWAEVVRLGEDLGASTDHELESMILEAKSRLSELNLQEAHTRFSQGDIIAGREHLELARSYGATPEQIHDIDQLSVPAAEEKVVSSAHHSSCSSCAVPDSNAAEVDKMSPDHGTDWELLLAGLPDFMAEAYLDKPDSFKLALLKGYEGQDADACGLFEACDEVEQDVHFHYEYGAALCRSGRSKNGIDHLFTAVEMMPEHRFAWEMLVDLDASGIRVEGLDQRLSGLTDHPTMRGFAAAAHVKAAWQAGDGDQVLMHGKTALDEGDASPEVLQMMAGIFEARGDFEQAEMCLSNLPSGGCGGGVHPALAEFWLRRSSHLNQALESFKQASRQDSDNPRWLLRIAQTYMAKGWQRDGLKLLNQLAAVDDLPPQLAEEVKASLEHGGNN